jgi:hypothetical protein
LKGCNIPPDKSQNKFKAKPAQSKMAQPSPLRLARNLCIDGVFTRAAEEDRYEAD